MLRGASSGVGAVYNGTFTDSGEESEGARTLLLLLFLRTAPASQCILDSCTKVREPAVLLQASTAYFAPAHSEPGTAPVS